MERVEITTKKDNMEVAVQTMNALEELGPVLEQPTIKKKKK